MKFLFSFFLLLAFSAQAEIKQMQIRVLGETTPPIGMQFSGGINSTALAPRGGFNIGPDASHMVPVKARRIVTFRMPFIYRQGHEVLLVGPYLDVCGEVQIINEDNEVIATIRQAAFTGRGKKNFFIQRDEEFRDEGYISFRITEAVMERIGRSNFKIKVGPVADLDIVECKVVNRYEAEGILVSGDGVTREMTGSHVRTRFPLQRDITVKIKIRGGSAGEEFQFNNGVDKNLIYFRSSCNACDQNYLEGKGSIRRTRLFAQDDGIEFTVRSAVSGALTRQSGELIAIADAGAGNWSEYTPDRRNGSFAVGQGPSRYDRGEGWGPYLFLREAAAIYRFGQYTDLYEIQTGDGERCSCEPRGYNPPPGAVHSGPITSGTGGNNNNAAAPLTLTLQNVFQFRNSNSGAVADNFGTTANLCLTATDPNPKVTTIGPLTAVLRSGTALAGLTVRFRRGTTVLATVANVSVAANGQREVPFTRPESRVCVTRSPLNASICKRCGDGIQGIPVWDDEGIIVEVLQGNAVLVTKTITGL
ncbi:MAG: hypothetical protein EOO08_08690 [Chitinophagaceae bacterium]|nr:MAG: hypothetical protein EOO08_08690 [Chitinophagaceae bacterium]